MSSIALRPEERKALLGQLRHQRHPQLRLRAHIILLLADGHSWALICSALYCSSRTVARWKARFEDGRVPALLGLPRGAPARLSRRWLTVVLDWVLNKTPRAFGFLRSRWSCELLMLLLWQEHGLDVSRETVRRGLLRSDVVWRRPRPVLRRQDPRKEEIVAGLRELLLGLPEDETVVFQDEVDVELNPKIGCMWMRLGRQAEVVTPGDNEKCYLAGSLHWRTGVLFETVGPRRDGALFVRHLDEVRRRLRRYKRIHVICDNAKFHKRGAVVKFLQEHGERLVLHYLPRYAPDCNPIERVWWRLREAITRNHHCQTLGELVDLVLAWLTERKAFRVQDSVYAPGQAA